MSSLDRLPGELIAHVACFTNASTVLSLSETCKRLRAASYDVQIFRDLLATSRVAFENSSDINLEAVTARCSHDVKAWARYALADQRAYESALKECPLESPESFVRWLPELLVVKHSFSLHPCWKRFLREPEKQSLKQVFCQTVATLASDDEMPQLDKSLKMHHDELLRGTDTSSFLWSICTIALALRAYLKTRQAAWPFNSNARVPYIRPPLSDQIPMQPLNHSYDLPLPFTATMIYDGQAMRTTRFGDQWEHWYQHHSGAMLQTLHEGTWCGYYIHSLEMQPSWFDPPMVDIKFVSRRDKIDDSVLNLRAEDCTDGIGSFDLHGQAHAGEGIVKLYLQKDYQDRNISWDWDCRLTPFGIVGYWGSWSSNDEMRRNGLVWLWKKEWTG